MTFALSDVWVTGLSDTGSGSVDRINGTTNTVTAKIGVGRSPNGIAFDDTNIWVVNSLDATVSKIDPTTNTVSDTLTVDNGPDGVAFDGTNVWVTCSETSTVYELPR